MTFAALHPSGVLSLALVDEEHRVSVVRLDADLVPVAEAPLVDAQAATDPMPVGRGDAASFLLRKKGEAARRWSSDDDMIATSRPRTCDRMAYRPARWLPNPHLMTMVASLARWPIRLPTRRERWSLPDGDFVDVDRLDGPSAAAPRLLALHGLEGSSRAAAPSPT